jgi:hypothetical protein
MGLRRPDARAENINVSISSSHHIARFSETDASPRPIIESKDLIS